MSLGSVIKAKRTQLGLTLDEVAEAIGTSKSYVYEMENDAGKDVGFKKAIALSVALNIPINILAAEHIKD